jgi:ABC-type branched-subunit amino acid transport system ATPase component
LNSPTGRVCTFAPGRRSALWSNATVPWLVEPKAGGRPATLQFLYLINEQIVDIGPSTICFVEQKIAFVLQKHEFCQTNEERDAW